ncbi:MAG: DUF5830 family protein [Methanococcoides sp.]|nr:DUF5830 family protein [Methanococcoides sp.]
MKYSKTIQKGLDYIATICATELSPLEIRTLLSKTVTKNYDVVHDIMEAARTEGIVEKRDGTYHFCREAHALEFYKPKIVFKKESSKCRCCGRAMNECWYIELKSGIIGPYGSTCVRKLYLEHLFEEE